MIANKHLGKCTDECKYNTDSTCAFSLRTDIGCFLNSEVRIYAEEYFEKMKDYSIEYAKRIVKEKI